MSSSLQFPLCRPPLRSVYLPPPVRPSSSVSIRLARIAVEGPLCFACVFAAMLVAGFPGPNDLACISSRECLVRRVRSSQLFVGCLVRRARSSRLFVGCILPFFAANIFGTCFLSMSSLVCCLLHCRRICFPCVLSIVCCLFHSGGISHWSFAKPWLKGIYG